MGTLQDLQVKMTEAVKVFQATGDMSKIQEVTKAMDKAKAEIAKGEAEKLLKESEALAGKRENLAKDIHLIIKTDQAGLDQKLKDVKAWGFTYKVDKANPSELDMVYKSVSLSTQTVKARKAGGGGGASGKSKDEYGLSLSEIVAKFATAEELAGIAAADTNSKSWQLKVAVKKAAIAAEKLAPVK